VILPLDRRSFYSHIRLSILYITRKKRNKGKQILS
jgi:hypothetical protein